MKSSPKRLTLIATLLAIICAFVVPTAQAADVGLNGKSANKPGQEIQAVTGGKAAKKAGGKKNRQARKARKAKKAQKAKKARKAKRAKKHA
jgi:hypothetical protein